MYSKIHVFKITQHQFTVMFFLFDLYTIITYLNDRLRHQKLAKYIYFFYINQQIKTTCKFQFRVENIIRKRVKHDIILIMIAHFRTFTNIKNEHTSENSYKIQSKKS